MILIVTTNQDTFNNPTIVGLLRKLVDKKEKVIIMSYSHYFKNPYPEVELIKIYYYNLDARGHLRFKELIKWILHHLLIFKLIVLSPLKIIIGVDPKGIVLARKVQKLFTILKLRKPRLDYLSFEIFFSSENAEKDKEIRACHHIRNLIIQDSERDNLLRIENKIPKNIKSFYIPVSPLINKDALRGSETIKPSFREKYNIPNDKKLLISFGTFENWSGADWILEAISKNSLEEYIFVIHSRYKFNPNNEIHKNLLSLVENKKQLIISDDYINTAEEVILFLKQFDAGFVFYQQVGSIYTGKNIYHIGASSGKFSNFMAAGIPVICNNLPTYIKLNNLYNFGFIIEHKEELTTLLRSNPDFINKKKNCYKLFDEVLNPEDGLESYINSINESVI